MNFEGSEPPPSPKTINPGGPGSSWRMMRLRRVYETAEEENRSVEEVAIERFGSLELFAEAKEERHILDERAGRKAERGRRGEPRTDIGSGGEKRLMFTEVGGSGGSSRSSSFRRPGQLTGVGAPSSPAERAHVNKRLDALRLPSQANSPLTQSHTPIPSVMTPPQAVVSGPKWRALSPSSLNKLQAKVLRAKLMDAPDSEKLEKEYEEELRRAHGSGRDSESCVRTRVEVLPTLDIRGKLYDVGHGKEDDALQPGNRRKKKEEKVRNIGRIFQDSPLSNSTVRDT